MQPHRLLDFLITEYGLKYDRALVKALGVSSPTISKVRHGKRPSANLILVIHKKTGMSIEDIESFLEEPHAS